MPGAAASYSFLFNLVAQLADKFPPPSVVPTPTFQLAFSSLVFLQLSVGLCWKWDFQNDRSLEKTLENNCFNTARSCGLAYSFAPCAIKSEKPSRQKPVMLKQERDGRRDAKVVKRLCHGRESQHRFPEGLSPPAVL